MVCSAEAMTAAYGVVIQVAELEYVEQSRDGNVGIARILLMV